jgi:hypothetical protein
MQSPLKGRVLGDWQWNTSKWYQVLVAGRDHGLELRKLNFVKKLKKNRKNK